MCPDGLDQDVAVLAADSDGNIARSKDQKRTLEVQEANGEIAKRPCTDQANDELQIMRGVGGVYGCATTDCPFSVWLADESEPWLLACPLCGRGSCVKCGVALPCLAHAPHNSHTLS